MKWNLRGKKSPHFKRKKGSGKGRKGKGKGFHGNQTLNFKIKEKKKAMKGNEGQKAKKRTKKRGGKKIKTRDKGKTRGDLKKPRYKIKRVEGKPKWHKAKLGMKAKIKT